MIHATLQARCDKDSPFIQVATSRNELHGRKEQTLWCAQTWRNVDIEADLILFASRFLQHAENEPLRVIIEGEDTQPVPAGVWQPHPMDPYSHIPFNIPEPGLLYLWRPLRPGFGRIWPLKAAFYIEDDIGSHIFVDLVERTWQDLQLLSWRTFDLDESWESDSLLEDECHAVLVDSSQFDPMSNWRASVLIVRAYNSDTKESEHEAIPYASRIPIQRRDLLLDLGLLEDDARIDVQINGLDLLSADAGRVVDHGAYIYIEIETGPGEGFDSIASQRSFSEAASDDSDSNDIA